MAKTTGLFRIIAGVLRCSCNSSIISKSRDKLKEQYNKYKEDQRVTKRKCKRLSKSIKF